MAMTNGLDLPIINPLDQELMAAIDAFNVLFNYDHDATNYIQKQSNQTITSQSKSSDFSLNDIIIHGLKEEVVNATKTTRKSTRFTNYQPNFNSSFRYCRKTIWK